MTLVDHQIREACRSRSCRDPLIMPFDEKQLQPSSYDVLLGDRFMVIDRDRRWSTPRPVDLGDPSTMVDLYTEFVVPRGGFYELPPGGFVLGHTIEILDVPSNMAAHVQGKSSIARLGIAIEAAGFIDPGYKGSITLEILNMAPVPFLLRPGLPIAQFSFQMLDEEPERPYGHPELGSHYSGSNAVVGSRYGQNDSIAPAMPLSYDERLENRPCKANCGKPFQDRQLYLPNGPYHIGCAPR